MARPVSFNPGEGSPAARGCQVSGVPGTVLRMSDEESGVGSAGGLAALNSAFVRERHALLGFVLGLVRDRAAAEEIVQEVWIRLARSADRGAEIQQPARWFRG